MEDTHSKLKSKKNNQRIAQSFGCMKVDKINPLKHEKIVSTMNYHKVNIFPLEGN